MSDHVLVAGPITTEALADRLAGPAPAGRGGMAVSRLVGGLLDKGLRVTVATNDPSLHHPDDEVVVRGERLEIRFGPYRPGGRARDVFAVERHFVQRVVEQVQADVVHAQWTYEEALGALAARPDTVVTVRDWGPNVLRNQLHPYRVVRLGMQAAVLRRARRVSVSSPSMQRRVSRVARGTVDLIPNSIDESVFVQATRPAPNPSPVLVAANVDFGRRKNVTALLEAFPMVRRAHPGATLRLFGHDYAPGGLAEQWASQRGLVDGVVFEGQVGPPVLLAAMRAADLFVHPSLEESFGNVLVEAMSQGVPVLGGRRSGAVPWVLGDAGLLVDVERPAEISEAAVDVLGDSGRWQAAAAGGRQRAWDEFRTGAVVDRFLELYGRVG